MPKKYRRGWTPGRFGTYGSREDSLTFSKEIPFNFNKDISLNLYQRNPLLLKSKVNPYKS